MLTVGVEEEFLLLEPGGAVAPVAADVVRLAGTDGQVKREYMAYQVETATPVCTRLDELRSELTRLRLLAAGAAERAGVRLVASGAPPFGTGPLDALTDSARYRELFRRFPDTAVAAGTCACQIHVGVADRDLAVDVLGRLRPWLPALLALAANSPFIAGHDSGWSSSRYRAQLRWPTFRPPAAWHNADRYDSAVRSLIVRGAALDRASVYFLARLSARYPTIEIRVADACLTAEDAVLLAGVARALTASLIEDARLETTYRVKGLDARLVAAARHGMLTRGVRRWGRSQSAVADLVARLLAKIAPALAAAGDADEIRAQLDRLSRVGTGAERQRDLWARSAGPRGFVAGLANATLPVTAVGRAPPFRRHEGISGRPGPACGRCRSAAGPASRRCC